MSKNICIFSSSSNAIDKKYFELTIEIGRSLSEKKYNLIFGAGEIGLMGALATVFKQNNCKIIGVIPEKLNKDNVTYKYCDELIVTKTMSERKSIMIEKADCFLALPGGFGTLEEILEVITLKQLGYIDKAICFYNINNFYNNLFNQFDIIYNQFFAKPIYKKLYFISNNHNEIINYLENYNSNQQTEKWF